MKIRDLITVSEKESDGFTEVTAEMFVKASCKISTRDINHIAHVCHVGQAKKNTLYQIDRLLFSDARFAFEEFERSMVLHLRDQLIGYGRLREELQEKADRVRKLLSIDGDRGVSF